jgi:acetylornithine deacetylase/succinyl-diaminopimelate desuccinylase-like protein
MDHPLRAKNGTAFARGFDRRQGQVFSHIKSAEAIIKTQGKLPLNLKYLVEGEEEVGSMGLGEFLKTNAKKLASDCIVISDGSQFAPACPRSTTAARHRLYEIHCKAPIAICIRPWLGHGRRTFGENPRRFDRRAAG